MKVEAVRVDRFRIPLPEALSDSTHGVMSHFELVAVRLTDTDGAEGVGYTYTVDCGGGAVAALIRDDLADWLRGRDPRRVERLWHDMGWRLHFVGRGGIAAFAMAAVDVALWDLKACRAGEPLWRLLGGFGPEVRAYAGGIDLLFPLGKLLAQTDENLGRGFRAIKMKVGHDLLAEDVSRVEAMRTHLGDGFPLMADANMRWRVDEAMRAAEALKPFGLVWLEEPTIPDDLSGHIRIASVGQAIATGENFHTVQEFRNFIAAGAVDFPEPDLATLGGITPWMKVAHMAEAHNLPVTSHGVHDLHVHLLAAVPNRSYLEMHGFGLERFIEAPLELRDGMVTAPDRPGHGIVLDWDGLARISEG